MLNWLAAHLLIGALLAEGCIRAHGRTKTHLNGPLYGIIVVLWPLVLLVAFIMWKRE